MSMRNKRSDLSLHITENSVELSVFLQRAVQHAHGICGDWSEKKQFFHRGQLIWPHSQYASLLKRFIFYSAIRLHSLWQHYTIQHLQMFRINILCIYIQLLVVSCLPCFEETGDCFDEDNKWSTNADSSIPYICPRDERCELLASENIAPKNPFYHSMGNSIFP